MAYVALLTKAGNRIGQKVTHDQAISILDVLEGRTEPADDKQAEFVGRVQKVYFAWRSADPLWIMANIEMVTNLAIASWAVDAFGRPVKPDSEFDWSFARKYELWKHKGPYGHAKNIIDRYQLSSIGYK